MRARPLSIVVRDAELLQLPVQRAILGEQRVLRTAVEADGWGGCSAFAQLGGEHRRLIPPPPLHRWPEREHQTRFPRRGRRTHGIRGAGVARRRRERVALPEEHRHHTGVAERGREQLGMLQGEGERTDTTHAQAGDASMRAVGARAVATVDPAHEVARHPVLVSVAAHAVARRIFGVQGVGAARERALHRPVGPPAVVAIGSDEDCLASPCGGERIGHGVESALGEPVRLGAEQSVQIEDDRIPLRGVAAIRRRQVHCHALVHAERVGVDHVEVYSAVRLVRDR
jgi:hypothetical protein